MFYNILPWQGICGGAMTSGPKNNYFLPPFPFYLFTGARSISKS
jgi:hypothetical protein